MELKKEFKGLEVYLQGNPKQFYISQNGVYCAAANCEGCPHKDLGCEVEDEAAEVQVSAIPHSRRGLGIDNREFLILYFRDGVTIESLPEEIMQGQFKESIHPLNLHWIQNSPHASKFRILKGMMRYYGTEGEFSEDPLADYLYVHSIYKPDKHLMAMDFSAIEPRVSTIVSLESHWLEIFNGQPKVIFKEVELKDAEELSQD